MWLPHVYIVVVLLFWRIEREESDEERASADESDEDEDDIPYNPKNLPLGWDGKVCTQPKFAVLRKPFIWRFFFFLAHPVLVVQAARTEH